MALNLDVDIEPRRLFRRLRLLGHMEYLGDGSRWTVTPPTWVDCVSPDHGQLSILIGARVPRMIDTLREEDPQITVEEYRNPGAPDLIAIARPNGAASEGDDLPRNQGKVLYAGSAGKRLAQVLPDLDGWREQLPVLERPPDYLRRRYRWNGEQFVSIPASVESEGFYEFAGSTAESGLTRYGYFDSHRNMWLQGDWYGLRFLANRALGRSSELIHVPGSGALIVSSEDRLPETYERSLVLASGTLASVSGDRLVYHGVDRDHARTIADKVGLTLREGVLSA